MDTIDRSGSGLTEITTKTDSRDILAHARRQADSRKFDDVFIVDADAHVDDGGNWAEITQYIEDPVIREAANSFGDGSRKGAFLNNVGGLQWQNVWGRIRHGRDQITLPDGTKKSVGVVLPATLTFGTAAPEIMECVAGSCEYKLAGTDAWVGVKAGEQFSVPGNAKFQIRVTEGFDAYHYICYFG